MKEEKVTKASILKSKARMMADRNERFAIIKEEMDTLKEHIQEDIKDLASRIRAELDDG